jgi:hypothetical protein
MPVPQPDLWLGRSPRVTKRLARPDTMLSSAEELPPHGESSQLSAGNEAC